MKIKNATFITSVASKNNFYKTDKPLICVVGKSNVGKSSIINMLAEPVAGFGSDSRKDKANQLF